MKTIQRILPNRWQVITIIIVMLVAIPILTILFGLISGPGESWSHIMKFLMKEYLANTLLIVLCCAILSTLFGVIPAWLVCRYTFPFKSAIAWMLILPLAVPNYLTAYAFAGIFDFDGIVQQLLGGRHVDIINIWGLSFILSASLFPYVYIATRSFFLSQSANQIDAGRLLGASQWNVFFKLALPMARPAIVAGLSLVLMEVLNDYGATSYFGIGTFSTAIFRAWFGLEEPGTAIYLAGILCFGVLVLIVVEKFQGRKKRYSNDVGVTSRMSVIEPSKPQQLAILLIAFIPALVGFVIPVLQIIYWSVITAASVWDSGFFIIIGQTFLLASTSAGLVAIISLAIYYAVRWSGNKRLHWFSRIAFLGYAVPGVVIGIGILVPSLFFDKWLIDFMESTFGISVSFLINGTIIGLLFAYVVRFMAVGNNAIESGYQRLSDGLDMAGRSLGIGRWVRLRQIDLPLVFPSILSGCLLVFVDVMKELPLTLLLKPYGVMTLSAKAYEYASDERIAEASLPSLIIVLVGIIPIIILNRLIQGKPQ